MMPFSFQVMVPLLSMMCWPSMFGMYEDSKTRQHIAVNGCRNIWLFEDRFNICDQKCNIVDQYFCHKRCSFFSSGLYMRSVIINLFLAHQAMCSMYSYCKHSMIFSVISYNGQRLNAGVKTVFLFQPLCQIL